MKKLLKILVVVMLFFFLIKGVSAKLVWMDSSKVFTGNTCKNKCNKEKASYGCSCDYELTKKYKPNYIRECENDKTCVVLCHYVEPNDAEHKKYYSNDVLENVFILYYPQRSADSKASFEVVTNRAIDVNATRNEYYAGYELFKSGKISDLKDNKERKDIDKGVFNQSKYSVEALTEGNCPLNVYHLYTARPTAVCMDEHKKSDGDGYCDDVLTSTNHSRIYHYRVKYGLVSTYLDDQQGYYDQMKNAYDTIVSPNYNRWISEVKESKNWDVCENTINSEKTDNEIHSEGTAKFVFQKKPYVININPASIAQVILTDSSPFYNYYINKGYLKYKQYQNEYNRFADQTTKLQTELLDACSALSKETNPGGDSEKTIAIINEIKENYRTWRDEFAANSQYINFPFDGQNTCEGYLGTETIELLVKIFNIMKYIGIILLLTLSTIDFVKAITSQDKDLLKKAGMTAVKRLVICIVLFFLPTLIKVFLGIFEIPSECNIT